MKGISPLLATIFVIAFTVGVAGLISVWLTGFTTTQTGAVGSSAEKLAKCASSAIEVSRVKFNCAVYAITNTSTVNVTVQYKTGNEILYNISVFILSKGEQNKTGGTSVLLPGDSISFALQNVNSTGSVRLQCPFDTVRATGLCQNATTVADECSSGEPCWSQVGP